MVEAAGVGADRFGFGNQLPGADRPAEIVESPIKVYIVDHQGAARPQRAPCAGHLEKHVVFAVLTVVNENIDRGYRSQKFGQSTPAWAEDKRPLSGRPFANGGTYFMMQFGRRG